MQVFKRIRELGPRLLLMAACMLALAPTVVVSVPASAQQITYLSDEEALALEHQTRFSRLKRLAQTFGVYPEPEFHSYVVPRRFMPSDFYYDIPVLRIVFPENTFFDTASSEVKPSAIPIIQAMAAMVDGDVPDVSMFIAGHADSRGGEVYNHNLSIERARSVARILESAKKRPTPLWTIGFGKSVPLYPNTSDTNMGWNRRVEFLLASRPDAIAYWLQDQVVDVCRTSDPAARVRCMRGFQTERKEFVAERVTRVRGGELVERSKGTGDAGTRKPSVSGDVGRAKVAAAPTDRIPIRLNERRVRVESIEH
ncbi:OmpA family protein [Sphingobium sp. Z007]|uniref:OmpA family protein n=2 Tax=Sphingobium sp. Z007 TaxID=627495 RepID=UPI000B49D2D5|nr:OmpA family protein [Sphingobium sp. Z007]